MKLIQILINILKNILSFIWKHLRRLFAKTKDINSIPKKGDIDTEEIKRYEEFLKDLGNNYQQKLAVVSKSPSIIVNAGAGSGKTKVLTKRIIHLIKNKKVNAADIIALTFNKDATNNMIDRLLLEFDSNYHVQKQNVSSSAFSKFVYEKKNANTIVKNIRVQTFHSFCHHILKKYDNDFTVLNENGENSQFILIKRIFSRFNEDFHLIVKEYIYDYILPKTKIRFKEDDVFVKHNTKKYYRTLRGEPVRSKSERDIANFLFQNGVDYEYEKETNFGEGVFHPDFYLPEFDIYIEHLSFLDDQYVRKTRWKIDQFKMYHKICIYIDEEHMSNIVDVYRVLASKIQHYAKIKLSLDRIMPMFKDIPYTGDVLNKVFELVLEMINYARCYEIYPEELEKRLEKVRHPKVLHFYSFFIPLYVVYQSEISSGDKKDFNELLISTINLLDSKPEVCRMIKDSYSHFLVDEFQDMNSLQVTILKKLISDRTNFFVVGDDWQAIYGWRASEPKFFIDFHKYFGKSKGVVLPYNYRNPKCIVQASNEVIRNNLYQTKKEIHSIKTKVDKIIVYSAKNDHDATDHIALFYKKYRDQGFKKQDFLILFRKKRHFQTIKKELLNRKISIPYSTIHKAKGLEYKIVFLIGLKKNDGFPEIKEESKIKQLIVNHNVDEMLHEERRVFYVALTRSIDKLHLITEHSNVSQFISEIPTKYTILKDVKMCDKYLEKLIDNNVGARIEALVIVPQIITDKNDIRYFVNKCLEMLKEEKRDVVVYAILDALGKVGRADIITQLHELNSSFDEKFNNSFTQTISEIQQRHEQ